MGIYIPNMEKPERCTHCIAFTLQEAPTHYAYDEPPYVYPYCELLGREVDDVDTIPTDCPLIDIVQCKDCKYWHNHEWSSTCDKNIGNGFPSDYFCADGERRADEKL